MLPRPPYVREPNWSQQLPPSMQQRRTSAPSNSAKQRPDRRRSKILATTRCRWSLSLQPLKNKTDEPMETAMNDESQATSHQKDPVSFKLRCDRRRNGEKGKSDNDRSIEKTNCKRYLLPGVLVVRYGSRLNEECFHSHTDEKEGNHRSEDSTHQPIVLRLHKITQVK